MRKSKTKKKIHDRLACAFSVFASILVLFACAGRPVGEKGDGQHLPISLKEDIRTTVRRHLEEVEKCYEAALDTQPMLEGKLVLTWDIADGGVVQDVKVKEAGEKIRPVARCVVEKLLTWRFAPPPQNKVVEVSYPFYFSENGSFPGLSPSEKATK